MKAKKHEKLAGFEREFIDSKISEKPVKSRIFGDLQGVENAPRGLLLSGRSEVRILSGTLKTVGFDTLKSITNGFFFSFLHLHYPNPANREMLFFR